MVVDALDVLIFVALFLLPFPPVLYAVLFCTGTYMGGNILCSMHVPVGSDNGSAMCR